MPPVPALKSPVQIAYLDKMERGLSLMLVLGAGGTKAFRALTYRNGKPRSFKFGTYPTTSLKQAKAKARDYFENPRKLEEQATIGTFKEIAENWVKRHVEGNGLLTGYELKRHLKIYVYPRGPSASSWISAAATSTTCSTILPTTTDWRWPMRC